MMTHAAAMTNACQPEPGLLRPFAEVDPGAEHAAEHTVDLAEESRLIESAKADADAFGQLYRRHYAAVAGYLQRRTGQRDAAEDLAAETFLAAWKALPRYRDRGVPFRAWLMRIATNRANRWARDHRRQQRLLQARGALSAAEDSGVTPDQSENHAQRALLQLTPSDQAVLVLHHVEGLSVAQVGAVLRLRSGTVKSRLHRARERLREVLQEQGVNESSQVATNSPSNCRDTKPVKEVSS